MTASEEFAALLTACRNGEPAALGELVNRYLPHVRAAVRSRLPARLRRRFDSHDFTQEVWASFLKVTLDRLDLADEGALVAYLAQMARNKVGEEYRHQTSQKVGMNRELSLDATADPPADTPTPSTEVVAAEWWGRLADGLDERYKRMLDMLRDGHTQVAIAREFGLTEKTVQRMLVRLNGRPATHG